MSLDEECDWRLENLYKESHIWLLQVATNTTKNADHAADMVSDLYLYLHNNKKQEIFWGVSYNLMYCLRYIQSRWINKREKNQRYKLYENMKDYDRPDEEYDIERDIEVMRAYDMVKSEVDNLKNTKYFAQAALYQMYWMTDDKLMDVANKIGISKSTTFNAIKKVKEHLKTVIKNPFND
jgi:DNA-directed RNA polymerase specialized sigma24 family protein